MIFVWFFKSNFPICSMLLHMPIPTILFSGFLTWGFHSHFVKVRYMTWGLVGRSIVCFGSPLCFSPYIATDPTCVFLFVANNTHIEGLISNAVPAFLRLQKKLSALSLLMQPTKCVVWSFQGLDQFISHPPSFLTLDPSFRI